MDETYEISKLLNAAWKVYHNRDSANRDKHEKPHDKKRHNRGKLSNTPKKSPSPHLADNQCTICNKKGHWKNECPTWAKKTPPVPGLTVNKD